MAGAVVVVGTGGTIARRGRHLLDFHDYALSHRVLSAGEVVARLPATCIREVRTTSFSATSSADRGSKQLVELRTFVEGLLAQTDVSAVVILHGTATLEETAYFLDLTLDVVKPVVVVGAQRPLDVLGTDGPLNLAHALATARRPALATCGVLVVMNGEIHAARDVTKVGTYALDAFSSPGLGPLGYVDVDMTVHLSRYPAGRRSGGALIPLSGCLDLPVVDIAYSHQGCDGTAIDAFCRRGCAGIIVAALAPGVVTPTERRAIERARADNVVVVLSTRAGRGRVVRTWHQQEADVIGAGDHNPAKARVLLMAAMAVSTEQAWIEECFARF